MALDVAGAVADMRERAKRERVTAWSGTPDERVVCHAKAKLLEDLADEFEELLLQGE